MKQEYFEEDSDSYEDDDEDYEIQKPSNSKRKGKTLKESKKKKKSIARHFFDEDAEESDNDDVEDIYKKFNQPEIQKIREKERELYTKRKTQQFSDLVNDMENDDIEMRYINELDIDDDDDEDLEGEFLDQIPANLKKLKIKVQDYQKIFLVPVRNSKEREVAICLLNKFNTLYRQKGFQEKIFSINHISSVKGSIFIEARGKKDLLAFLGDYHDVMKHKIEPISNEEFASYFEDQDLDKNLVSEGMFVKVSQNCRNSDYINDMGQVHSVYSSSKIVVKLIPRINIEDMKAKAILSKKQQQSKSSNFLNSTSNYLEVEGSEDISNDVKGFNFQKPKNRLFWKGKMVTVYKKPSEIEATRPEQAFFSIKDYEETFRSNNAYKFVSQFLIPQGDHCGYVYRSFGLKDLHLNYQPRTLAELTKFFPHLEIDEIIEENGKYLKQSNDTTHFMVGDTVQIQRGQMKGLKGKIITLNKDSAKILIKRKKVKIEEEVEVNDLIKYFEEGSRVKVISGMNEGKTGNVLSTKGDICTVFTDNKNTIEIRVKDLAVTGEYKDNDTEIGISGGGGSTTGSHQTNAMFDRTILKKKDLVKLTGFDRIGMILEISKDNIKVLDQNGLIKNESPFSVNCSIDTRNFVACNSEGSNITKNSNIVIKKAFVVENVNNVSLMTSNPILTRNHPKIAFDMKYGKFDNLRVDDMRQYVGKQMKIVGGKYKGSQCTVIDFRKDQVKVEINSKFLTVFIPKTDILAEPEPYNDPNACKTPNYATQSTYLPNFSQRESYTYSPS